MKLWLDDERDPKDPKIQAIFGSFGDEIWAKTAAVAINYLKNNNFVSISLDHDLGTVATGMDVAKWIEESAYNGTLKRLDWSIHSKNPVGSKNMAVALKNADRYWENNDELPNL